jgi:hypothetical protein
MIFNDRIAKSISRSGCVMGGRVEDVMFLNAVGKERLFAAVKHASRTAFPSPYSGSRLNGYGLTG